MPNSEFDFRDWIEEALRDDSPLAYETSSEPEASEPDEQETCDEAHAAESTPTTPEPVETSACFEKAGRAPQKEYAQKASPKTADLAAETKAPAQRSKVEVANTKLLNTAAEDCIAAALYEDGWSPDTIKQVRTAIAMFDFAAGGNIKIEDISQESVVQFKALCLIVGVAPLPNASMASPPV